MAAVGESSSALLNPIDGKPVVIRVKRKAFQSRLDGFWLEINKRPLKRPLLDFENLSISDSTGKGKLKTKKIFVRHVETVCTTESTADILQSFVVSLAVSTMRNSWLGNTADVSSNYCDDTKIKVAYEAVA